MTENGKLTAKTKLQITVVIFMVCVFVVGWGFVGAAVEERFTGWGALAGLGVMGVIFIIGGLLFFFAAHNKSVLSSVNQTDTKDEVTGLTKMAMVAQQDASRESMRLWDQQRAWSQAQHKALEEQRRALAQQNQMLQSFMVTQQHTVQFVMSIAQQMSSGTFQMPTPPMMPTQQTRNEEDEIDLINPFAPQSLIEPTFQEPVVTLQKVVDRPNQQRWERREATQHRKVYGPAATLLAQRIKDSCWMKCELDIDVLMNKLTYFSKRGLGEALDLLADDGYCDPTSTQGKPRDWTYPDPPSPS